MAIVQERRRGLSRQTRSGPKLVRRANVDRPRLASVRQIQQRRGSLLAMRSAMLEAEEDRFDVRCASRILTRPDTEWTDWGTVKTRIGLT